MDFGYTNACISDIDGKLKSYSNGCQINNSAFEHMENGQQINPGQVHRENCPAGRYPVGEQGAVFIPDPGDSMRYYLLHASGVIQDFPELKFWIDAIRYSIIDLRYNNGLGKVISKNVPIIKDSTTLAAMAVVKHSDNSSYWIIVKKFVSNVYDRFLIDRIGINYIGSQTIGDTTHSDFGLGGQTMFSPNDGKKMMIYSPYLDGIFLFDFDRNSGLLSNYKRIHVVDSMLLDGGACFSPSGRFLYVGTYWDLYQYDLEANDINASEVHIAHWNGFRYQNIFSHMIGRMQLGPDCKIYINCRNSMKFLHVINKPDEKGLACDFRQNQLELPQTHGGFLPSFPNYRLGVAPVCDPNLAVSVYEIPTHRYLSVYPNPASDEVSLDAGDQNIKSVQIIDLLGQLVYHQKINATPSLNIKLRNFNPGTYIAICTLQNGSILRSKLIVKK
ncbi:MAG: T9SS type A sorting domain-containing protein [Saprospiraceae bacterium]|nr:T9SS type A sorting domain-containing protein [Saprospiraceae bacterium]